MWQMVIEFWKALTFCLGVVCIITMTGFFIYGFTIKDEDEDDNGGYY